MKQKLTLRVEEMLSEPERVHIDEFHQQELEKIIARAEKRYSNQGGN